jgi:hypothetical protein
VAHVELCLPLKFAHLAFKLKITTGNEGAKWKQELIMRGESSQLENAIRSESTQSDKTFGGELDFAAQQPRHFFI